MGPSRRKRFECEPLTQWRKSVAQWHVGKSIDHPETWQSARKNIWSKPEFHPHDGDSRPGVVHHHHLHDQRSGRRWCGLLPGWVFRLVFSLCVVFASGRPRNDRKSRRTLESMNRSSNDLWHWIVFELNALIFYLGKLFVLYADWPTAVWVY